MALHQRLSAVLADLPFPAARWQAVTQAEWYGCDGVTRTVLERLPDRSYLSLHEMVAVLVAVLHGRPAPSSPAAAGAPRPAPRVPSPTRTTTTTVTAPTSARTETRTSAGTGTAAPTTRCPARTPTVRAVARTGEPAA